MSVKIYKNGEWKDVTGVSTNVVRDVKIHDTSIVDANKVADLSPIKDQLNGVAYNVLTAGNIELKYEALNIIENLSNDITVTFEEAPIPSETGYFSNPGYGIKVNLSTAHTITLPTRTYRLATNDPNITLAFSVLSLPASIDIDIEICGENIVAYNWGV